MRGNRCQRIFWRRVAAVALFAGLAMSARLYAQEQQDEKRHHEPIFITFDPPGSTRTYPLSINPEGAITGYYIDASFVYHGFLRDRDGSLMRLDAPGAGTGVNQGTSPASINPESAIAGSYTDANYTSHGFLRNRDGTFTDFDPPGSVSTLVNCINPAGTIIGEYSDAKYVTHGFLRDREGAFTEFDSPGSVATYPYSINPKGTIAGYYYDGKRLHGFVRDRDEVITTFDVPHSTGVYALGINPEGAITGFYSDANSVWHGFRRDRDGDITPFDAPGAGTLTYQGTFPVAINPEGAITGYYQGPPAAFQVYGFLLAPDGTFIDFDAPTGWVYNSPTSINAAGEITGLYSTGDRPHGYLRIPPCRHAQGDDEDNECHGNRE